MCYTQKKSPSHGCLVAAGGDSKFWMSAIAWALVLGSVFLFLSSVCEG